jgi:hypothetical protein
LSLHALFVIAGLTRNPVAARHWIPDRVRDDKLDVRDDSRGGQEDKLEIEERMT